MKNILIVLLSAIMFFACSESTTEPPAEEEIKMESFKSHNIKEKGKHFFTFASNSATTTDNGNWDIAFGSVPLTVETQPCSFFTMPNDPVILSGTDISIAKIEVATLGEVTSVPAANEFKTDDNEGSAVIGKNWFDNRFQVKQDVYVIKTCEGNFALLDIERYEIDMSAHQITSITWKFKYNNNGSTDFSTTTVDSLTTANAYNVTRYYSFANGVVGATDTYDIKVIGSSIWLGNKVSVKKLENKSLADISTITDNNFLTDTLPSFVTTGWYNYGDGHTITPRDYVYVVNTPDGKYPAFEITNYYDAEGKSGTYTIEWKYLK